MFLRRIHEVKKTRGRGGVSAASARLRCGDRARALRRKQACVPDEIDSFSLTPAQPTVQAHPVGPKAIVIQSRLATATLLPSWQSPSPATSF